MRHLATAKKLWKLILLLSRVISEVCIDTQNPPSQNEHTHTYLHLTGVFGGHDAASPTFKIYVSGCLGVWVGANLCIYDTRLLVSSLRDQRVHARWAECERKRQAHS